MMAGMLEEHRNILKRHRVDLVRDLEPSKVLNDLYECLDEDDREAVKAHSTRVARAEELVDMIPRRGPEAFQCFVAALYKRQRHLAMPLIEESGIDSSSFEKADVGMTDQQKKILLNNFENLQQMNLDKLAEQLHSCGLLDDIDWQNLLSDTRQSSQKIDKLLSEILPRKGPKAFEDFARELEKVEPNIAQKLLEDAGMTEMPLGSCAPSTSLESQSMASAAATSRYLMTDFNYLLRQIASEINSDELTNMKSLCEEDNTLPGGKREQIADPRELLNILRKSGKIRPGEAMYLVTLLQRVGLVPLAERVKEKGQLTSTADPTLPYKGTHFEGREAVVQEVIQKLTQDPNPSRIISIVGIPGMGKTQVAIHVSHLLKEEHKKAVIFIEEKQKLTEICSEILREINPLAPRLSESHDMVMIAKRRLKELKEKKVIVLDSVEGIQQQGKEFDDFLRYVETYAPHVQLIITTRKDVGFRSFNIHEVRLDGLDSESSAKLLQDLVPNCEERHIKELGNLCGGIPLVLVNCAGLLEEDFNPEELVARLKENPIPLFKANAEDIYNALRQFLVNISENIKANLVRLSVFPSAFSVRDMKALFGDVLEPEAVKNTMIRRSLLRRIYNEKLVLHPLVRQFLKAERKLLNMDVVGEKAQHKFNQHYLELLETSSKQFISKTWSQNAIFTFRTEKANILEMFNNFLQEAGDKKEKESCIDFAYSTKVLDFLAKVLSPPSECVKLYKKFYHIAEASSNTRRLADCLNALGFLLLCEKAHRVDSHDAVEKFQRAYEIRKNLPKELQHCETHAHTISKLGLCYALQGEVGKGLKLIQEAVDLRKKLGVRLYVAAGYCDLGNAHRASGNHEQAINIWKTETLPVYKDELGDHPWTASILRYIASSYRCLAESESADSGMADEAEMYSRKALELRIKLLGEHHDTARSHVDLSDIFYIKKEFKSALEQLEEAIEMQKKVLGEEHETTKKTLEQLKKVQSMVE